MTPLREWSFGRVVLAGAGWVVLSVALIGFWIFLQITWSGGIGSGSGGIGAVTIAISELLLLIPLLPPIVLFVVWLIARVRR
jgi:hypothetical protein